MQFAAVYPAVCLRLHTVSFCGNRNRPAADYNPAPFCILCLGCLQAVISGCYGNLSAANTNAIFSFDSIVRCIDLNRTACYFQIIPTNDAICCYTVDKQCPSTVNRQFIFCIDGCRFFGRSRSSSVRNHILCSRCQGKNGTLFILTENRSPVRICNRNAVQIQLYFFTTSHTQLSVFPCAGNPVCAPLLDGHQIVRHPYGIRTADNLCGTAAQLNLCIKGIISTGIIVFVIIDSLFCIGKRRSCYTTGLFCHNCFIFLFWCCSRCAGNRRLCCTGCRTLCASAAK